MSLWCQKLRVVGSICHSGDILSFALAFADWGLIGDAMVDIVFLLSNRDDLEYIAHGGGVTSTISSHKLRANMGIRGRKIAESISWKNIAEKYNKIYKEIINKGDQRENK